MFWTIFLFHEEDIIHNIRDTGLIYIGLNIFRYITPYSELPFTSTLELKSNFSSGPNFSGNGKEAGIRIEDQDGGATISSSRE